MAAADARVLDFRNERRVTVGGTFMKSWGANGGRLKQAKDEDRLMRMKLWRPTAVK